MTTTAAPRRINVWLLVYAGIGLFYYLAFFERYPILELHSKLFSLLSIVFLFLSLYSLGNLILRFTGISLAPFTQIGVSFGVGIGMLSQVVLLIGWAIPGKLTLKLTAVSILLGVFALVGVVSIRKSLKNVSAFFSTQSFSLHQTVLLGLAFAGIVVTFLNCFSPITYYDSLVYHLAIPDIYNHADKIIDIPFNLYSYFPGHNEMVYLYILNQLIQPDYVVNLYGFAISLTCGFILFEWAFERGGLLESVVAFFLWWTMPAVLFLSLGAYIDISLAFQILCAIRLFALSRKNNWSNAELGIAGLFCGFAFATKYTGAMCFILLFVFLLWEFSSKRIGFKSISVFLLCAAAPTFLWLLKNYVFIKNPVFPFFYQYLGNDIGWTTETAAGYFELLTEYSHKTNIIKALVLSPYNAVIQGLAYGGGFDVLGTFGWGLLILMLPLAFLASRKNEEQRLLCLYFIGHYLFWFISKPVLRFLLGGLPILILITSHGFRSTVEKFKKSFVPLQLLFFPWIVSNLFLYALVSSDLKLLTVSIGQQPREEFLTKRLNYYATFKYANNNVKNGKVLLIGEQRTFHLKVPFSCGNIFAPSPIANVCNKADSLEPIETFLKNNGLTHLIINKSEIVRLGGLPQFGFNEKGATNFSKFVESKFKHVYSENNVDLFEFSS